MGLKSKPSSEYPIGEIAKIIPEQKKENAKMSKELQKEYEDKALHTPERTGKTTGIKNLSVPHTESMPTPENEFNKKTTVFQKSSFQELAKEKITHENPRLLGYPNLLNLFVEILFYRWSGKKKKDGYVQATINQISVGIQLTEEESNAVMLDDNPVQ